MIFGIGTDLFGIKRMRNLISSEDPFFQRAFTVKEREQAAERSDPVLYFSTHFAGKEAVYKAISRCGCDFCPEDIEILDSEDGLPLVHISGNTMQSLTCQPELRLLVSLSYEDDYAIAYAVAERIE